jgi:hypothetical protein
MFDAYRFSLSVLYVAIARMNDKYVGYFIYNVFGLYPIKPKPTHIKKCIQGVWYSNN